MAKLAKTLLQKMAILDRMNVLWCPSQQIETSGQSQNPMALKQESLLPKAIYLGKC